MTESVTAGLGSGDERRGARLRGAALAGVAVGVLIGPLSTPGAAHARPPIPQAPPACGQYGFDGLSSITVNEQLLSFTAVGPHVDGEIKDDATGATSQITGDINAQGHVFLRVGDGIVNNSNVTFTGDVGPDRVINGVRINPDLSTTKWRSTGPVKCETTPAAAAAAPAPAQPGAAQPPAPGANMVVMQATGGGTASIIDVYDPQTQPRLTDVPLPYTDNRGGPVQSGALYQIVVESRDADTLPGCVISVGNQVEVSQPEGGSGHCVWSAP